MKSIVKSLAVAAAALLLLAVPSTVAGAVPDSVNGGDYVYSWSSNGDGTIKITGCSPSPEGELEIPSVIDGKRVTSMGDRVFKGCRSLTSVTIPAGVTVIPWEAFRDCSALESVNIPDGVTRIGSYAFYECGSLKSVTIPDSVRSIGGSAFRSCFSLESLTIPYGVTKIEGQAFINCTAIKSLTIPGSVSIIGARAFGRCLSLVSVDISEGVKAIGQSAFEDCSSLARVTIPKSIVKMEQNVFQNTSLESVTIGHGVTHIWDGVFRGCSSLVDVEIPDSVTSIGDEAFRGCSSLVDVEIPDSVTSIGSGAFRGCSSLVDVEIPDSVTHIGSNAFSGCSSLESVTIPGSVEVVDEGAFEYCYSLRGVTMLEGVRYIDKFAFSLCRSLVDVTMPDSLTRIGYSAFRECNALRSVTIPDGVTRIDDWAFFWCRSLRAVSLPENLRWKLSSEVFYGCPSYMVVSFRAWTIKYHGNNGKDDSANQSFDIGEEKRLYYMNSRLGWEYKDEDGFNYVFLGWAKSPTGAVAYENGEKVQDLEDGGRTVHLYAVWQKRTYEVCFHSNDDRDLLKTQEFRPNIAKNLYWLDSGLGWTRPGYDFLGWAKSPTSTAVVYANGQKVNNLVAQGQTLHLYAVWRDRRWTIRYHRNYSSADDEYMDHKIPVGASVKLYWLDSQLGWTRDGYWFKGWAKSRSAGATYQNGQVVKDLVPGGEVLHIYGAWGQKAK